MCIMDSGSFLSKAHLMGNNTSAMTRYVALILKETNESPKGVYSPRHNDWKQLTLLPASFPAFLHSSTVWPGPLPPLHTIPAAILMTAGADSARCLWPMCTHLCAAHDKSGHFTVALEYRTDCQRLPGTQFGGVADELHANIVRAG